MKKILLTISTIVFLNSFSYTQTPVPGGNVSGTWVASGSPYQIQGEIQIPNDSTLIIEPGVTVSFQDTFKLIVQGRLLAIGTSTDTITFTAVDTTIGWRSIRFDNTPVTNDTSKFIFCKIQYSKETSTGAASNGGALYFNYFSKAIISNCLISDNEAFYAGGGIYCNYSNPIISGNKITNNYAHYHGGGIACYYSSPEISNNIISNDTAGWHGGGIFCYQSSPLIESNDISYNSSDYDGGICCDTYSNPTITKNSITHNYTGATYGHAGGITCCWHCSPLIDDNIISNNTSSDYGGGIYCESYCDPIISNNIISYNSGDLGGGIHCYYSSPLITNNSIFNNSANKGGGIYAYHQYSPKIRFNIISDNIATISGGGVYCEYYNNAIIINTTIVNNTAADGGGIYSVDNSNMIITNSTISNNSANKGGALYCNTNSDPVFKNTILWGNTASTNGTEVFLNSENCDPDFYYCDVQGDTSSFGLNGTIFYTGNYSNNLNIDPLFVDPLTADWSLQIGSDCIDAGTPDTTGLNLPSVDLAGNLRVTVCRIDIGAYENQYATPLTFTISSADAGCSTCPDGSATATVSGGTLPYTYLWDDSSSQTTQTAIGLLPGIYTVIVTDSNSCSLTDSIEVSYVISVNETMNASLINIYPNPATDKITIIAPEKSVIEILDINDQFIKTIKNHDTKSIIDLTDFSRGVYIIKVRTDQEIVIKKFIKQ